MSWSLTDRGVVDGGSGSGDIVSSAFVPPANAIVAAYILHNGGNDAGVINGISGHGTWARIIHQGNSGPTGSIDNELWAAKTGGSPSSSAVTIDRDYVNRCDVLFIDIDETAGFPVAIADCFGTPAFEFGYGTYEQRVATVAAFTQATNLALALLNDSSGAADMWSVDAGYTELSDVGGGGVAHPACHYKGSEDTTISATCNNFNLSTGIMGVEVKHAAAGAGNPYYYYAQQ